MEGVYRKRETRGATASSSIPRASLARSGAHAPACPHTFGSRRGATASSSIPRASLARSGAHAPACPHTFGSRRGATASSSIPRASLASRAPTPPGNAASSLEAGSPASSPTCEHACVGVMCDVWRARCATGECGVRPGVWRRNWTSLLCTRTCKVLGCGVSRCGVWRYGTRGCGFLPGCQQLGHLPTCASATFPPVRTRVRGVRGVRHVWVACACVTCDA
eukprot:364415-Chlamydomonas_euryale.AAC.8